jgi:hypothetical protein
MLSVPQMVLIGGNSRNTGKTTIACELIRLLSATHEVVGLKVTSIRPGEETFHGQHETALPASGFSLFEETDLSGRKDTSKMLLAGAKSVYYIQTPDSGIERAFSAFRLSLTGNPIIVCESRSLRRYVEPGYFVMMMRDSETPVKMDDGFYASKADLRIVNASHVSEILKFAGDPALLNHIKQLSSNEI